MARAWQLGIKTRDDERDDLARAAFAEFLATLLFLFLLITPVQFIGDLDGGTKLLIAWQHGLAIAVLVYVFAGVSGANINPAVTFGLVVAKRISLERAVLYVLAQCMGATAGAGLAMTFLDGTNGGTTTVAPGVEVAAAFGGEVICTFLLVTAVFAATDGELGRKIKHMEVQLPIAVGFAVATAAICLLAVDGCSINPARSLGAAIVTNTWEDHWVFWAGPLLGGLLSALVWEGLLRPSLPSASNDKDIPVAESKEEGGVV